MKPSSEVTQGTQGAGVFASLAEFVLRWRLATLAVALAVVGVFGHQAATNLVVDTSVDALVDSESESANRLNSLYDAFGNDNIFQVVVRGPVFSMEYLERLQALHEAYEMLDLELESVVSESVLDSADLADLAEDDDGWANTDEGTIFDEVLSLINARQTTTVDGALKVDGLLDDWPASSQLAALEERVLADPALVGKVIDSKSSHSVIILRTGKLAPRDVRRVWIQIEQLAKVHRMPGFETYVAGYPAMTAALDDMIGADMQVLLGLSLVGMLFLLGFLFRHPIGVIGPILVVVFSCVCTVGAMALFDVPMTIVTNVMPLFLIAVGIGDSVHIQSVYRTLRSSGQSNEDAIIGAVATTGKPVLLTTLTTCLGLVSFQFATLGAIQDLGVLSAFGVLMAFVFSVTILPALLSFNGKSTFSGRSGSLPESKTGTRVPDVLDKVLGVANHLSVGLQGRRWILGISLLIALTAFGSISTLRVSHDALTWFPDDHPTKVAFRVLDDNVGGASSVAMLVRAKPGSDLRNRELLEGLSSLEAHIESFRQPVTNEDIVHNVSGILDVVRESNRALHDNQQSHYVIPETQQGATDTFTLFENSDRDELQRVQTVDGSMGLMVVRVKWMNVLAYTALREHIEKGIETYLGSEAEVVLTGTVYTQSAVFEAIVLDLLRSFGFASIVITFVMMFFLRSVRLGLLAMLPNLLPIALVLGTMGLLDIPLDLNTLLIASIAIGIVVDDTIHFLHQFKHRLDEGGTLEEAMDQAFERAGRAIVTTSMILLGGFSVYNAASMSNVRLFGMLVGLTIVYAVVVDLILLPALIRFFGMSVVGAGSGRSSDPSGLQDFTHDDRRIATS